MGFRLTRVQMRNFTMRCNLYAPGDFEVTGKLVENYQPFDFPTVENCPCRIEASVDADQPVDGLGSSNVDEMDTTDRLRLPAQLYSDDDDTLIEPGDGWVMQIVSGAGSSNGNWYTFQGAAQASAWRGLVNQYLVKRSPRPPLSP